MAWDSSRPVDWNRLFREWLIYAALMAVIFLVLFRDRPLGGIIGGVLFSLPLYLGLGYVLAKFGLQRNRFGSSRSKPAAAGDSANGSRPSTSSSGPRPKPAPTKRTGGGTAKTSTRSSAKRRR